jgi:hypothetical protein
VEAEFYLSTGGQPDQSQLPFYVLAASRIAAALLFVIGGIAALGGLNRMPRTRKQGSGIGLSLCKQIVLLHRGTIQVQSAEGEGTTFMLRFS